MITTRFLPAANFDQYGEWIKRQDQETRNLYFGMATSDAVIDSLMDRVHNNLHDHRILVAQDGSQWVGTLHMAMSGRTVEFGLIVRSDCRGQGIASVMLEQALTWVKNRGYQELFMHCLGHNRPIQHLCAKHGLPARNMHGDSEVKLRLSPPTWLTMISEINTNYKNIWYSWLQKS